MAWSERVSGTGEWLNDVAFRDENNAVSVSHLGAVIHSDNGGINWSPLVPPSSSAWNAVDFTPAGGILLTGGNGSLWQSDPAWSDWSNAQTGANMGCKALPG